MNLFRTKPMSISEQIVEKLDKLIELQIQLIQLLSEPEPDEVKQEFISVDSLTNIELARAVETCIKRDFKNDPCIFNPSCNLITPSIVEVIWNSNKIEGLCLGKARLTIPATRKYFNFLLRNSKFATPNDMGIY